MSSLCIIDQMISWIPFLNLLVQNKEAMKDGSIAFVINVRALSHTIRCTHTIPTSHL